ncbi:unnamed protein product [Lymnaea stagnalis]|uniref:C2H2-type domain-containing protein n=1 Tax=Lymnaea stagnalis TaxID=6523 RepID=A0AAV2I3F0_LYMST
MLSGAHGNLRLSTSGAPLTGDMSTVSRNSLIGKASIVCQVSSSSQLASQLTSHSGIQAFNFIPSTSSSTPVLQDARLTSLQAHPPHSLAPPVKNPSITGQPDDLYRCHMCVLLFQTMNQLKHHIKNDPHRFKGCLKQYACVQCSMRFSNKTNLIRHNLMNHQEDENFKFRCYTCGKGFSTETYLKMHARFHSGKNFPCKYGCPGVFFPNAASLVKHLRTQHAGLDLKEYTKNVKAEKARRKKINRVFGMSDEQFPNIGLPEKEIRVSSMPYSLNQPGIGFQAKRVKTKSPLTSSTPPDMKSLQSLVLEKPSDHLMMKEEVKNIIPQAPKFQFKCKLCDKGFTTHLRLLQHRTQRHGASQSVQEYLYHMSKDVNEDDSAHYDSDQCEFSPPQSPKTFFANVNRRGFFNMKHHIDGGTESLLSWKKHLQVEGFVSISEPTLPKENTDPKMEWTFYNFPLYFQYQADCTQFYEEELVVPKLEQNALSQQLVNEAGALGQIVHEPGQSQEIDSLTSTHKSQLEELVSKDGFLSGVSGPVTIKIEAEECSFGVKSQERSSYIISKLEQHLQGYYGQEQSKATDETLSKDFGSNKSVYDNHIKSEVFSEDEDINDKANNQNSLVTDNYSISNTKTKGFNGNGKDSRSNWPLGINKKTTNTCEEDLDRVVQNKVIKLEENCTDDDAADPSAFNGLDSGISSLSSSECPSLDCSRPATWDQKNLVDSRDHISEPKELGVVKTVTKIGKEIDKKKNLSAFSMAEKISALKSTFMQSINLESGLKTSANVNNLPQPINIDHSLTLIQALNLHITGSQLPMSKILAMIEKNQDLHFYPTAVTGRNRTVSLSSLGPVLQNKEPQSNFDPVLNTSDSLKHDHRRYSIWSGQVHPKVLKDPEENTFCCPVVETVRKQEMLRLKEQYVFEKDTRDKEVESKQTQSVHAKLDFIEKMGLMTRKEFELSHHAKKREEHIIKPPEIWRNYENIWFGKKGTITVVCSICHRHFSCWDLCLRHQLKKHPHIEPASLEMERDNDVEDLYYYYPMRYGILAQTQLIPDDLPSIEVYVCTRCGFPFKNINRLHSHIIACDPAQEEVVSSQNGNQKLSYMKKKLLPMMDRRLHQDPDPPAAKSRAGKSVKTSIQSESNRQQSKLSTRQSGNVICSLPKAPVKPVKSQQNHANFSTNFSFYSGKKHKNYELLYNPQNHTRRREQYKVLDQHQCHGCNLKFKSLSMLERHVKKCSGRDKLQSQKPLVSQVMPDDAALRKQHTCRYCSKRFTFIKGVDLHYKRICSVRKVKEDENLLTREDLAHEEELKRIIEHLKWSKTLNKDSSDIIQGHVRVEEDGTLTRVVKSRGGARSLKKNVKKKSSKWTSMKKHGNEEESSLSSSISNTTQSLSNSMEDTKTKPEAVFAESLEKLGKRLTRSSSLEKISPSSGSGLKRKSSVPVSVLDGLPTGKKNRSLSQSSSYSSLKNEDYSTATETRSGTSRKNGATSKKRGKSAQRNAPTRKVRETKKKIEKSSQKRSNSKGAVQGGHEKSPGIQLPARKRGRPLKYDPSDTVYLKKKKPRNSTKQRVTGKEKGDEKKSLSRPSRSKTTSRVSKNEIVCETWESKQKAKTSSKTKKQTGIKNNQPIDTSMMIEKMKQLKEAAKLESENINKTKRANQAKRAELRKVSASKKLEKSATLVGAGLVSRDLSPNKHSTELFKHLTKGNCKSSTVKEIQSSSTNSLKEKSTLQSPLSKSSSISTYNTLKRKSLEHASSAGTSQSKKCASSPRSPTVQIQSKSSGKSKNYSTLRTNTAISPKELTKTDSSKVIEKTPTQPAPAKSSKSSCSEVSNPVHKQQPVSVRVVTLSPNGMNLLTYDTPPGDFKSSVARMSSSSIKLSPDISSIQQTKKVSTLRIHKEPIQILGKSPVPLVGKGPQSQNPEQTLQSMEKNQGTNFVIQKPNQVIQKPNQVIQVPGLKMSTTGNHIVYKCTESPADKAKDLMVDPKPGNQMILKCTDGRLMHVVSDEDMCTYEDSDDLLASVEKQRLSAPVATTPESPSALMAVVSTPKSSACHAVQKQGGVMNICTKPSPSILISHALTSQGEQMKGGFIKQVQVVKDAGESEKVHFISPSVISQAAVASNVQMCGPILTPGNVSTVLAAPQVTKQTTASLVLPVSAKGSKFYTPSTRFGLPSPELPNIVHGGIVPTGTKVLKLGNIISAGASMTRPLTENVVSQVGKNTGLPTIVTERSNLLNPRQVQRVATPVIRQQPPFTQKTTGCTPRSQVITFGRSAQTSNVQTVLIQHSPNSLSQPVQIQQPTPRNILTLPASSNIVPSGQVYPSSTSKVVTNRQPRNVQRPSSLLSNQIMISLDDGTTAMLDPDSLAQFLSMSPSLNKNEMESITGANTATTDPEHVMVNMAEIQPSCHVDEITWPSNGSVDLTDLPDCTSDF